MRTPAIAQLVVRLPLDAVLASPVSVTGPSLTLELGGEPTSAPWTGEVAAARHLGQWRRGRHRGHATVDLVPANDHETLMLLALEQPSGWWSATVTHDESHDTARTLRAHLESRPAADVIPLPAPQPEPTVAARLRPA